MTTDNGFSIIISKQDQDEEDHCDDKDRKVVVTRVFALPAIPYITHSSCQNGGTAHPKIATSSPASKTARDTSEHCMSKS